MGNVVNKVLGTLLVGTAVILGVAIAIGVPLNIFM